MTATLISSGDPQLEAMLNACGLRVTVGQDQMLAALAQPGARQPDVLVVDQRFRSVPASVLATIKRLHPSTGVMVVLPRLDPTLMLDAMRAGVNECLADPLTQADLQAALDRMADRRQAETRGEVFAVVGAKGGVGATTVAVNLASSLAALSKSRGTSTLVIDLHLNYGDAGVFLGADPRFSIVDALENVHRMDASLLRSMVTQTKSGVHLLASSERAIAASVNQKAISELIDLASTLYPYVVLDVPRSDSTMLDALEAAGAVVVVANQELATVRNAARLASMLRQRYGQERVSVVMTRYDEQAEIGQQDIERVVGQPVLQVFPNNYAMALSSLNKGRPLVLENQGKLAGAFGVFARVLARVPEPRAEAKPSGGGLFGLLGGKRQQRPAGI